MKRKTQVKFIFCFLNVTKKQNAGFTLIELLVTIIIIGILSAIALPSFLSQANKARQSEARTSLGAMNRAQQTYYLEKQKFVDDASAGGSPGDAIAALGLGIKDSANYLYRVELISSINTDVANKAQARMPELKGYAGGVFASAELTQAILCEDKIASLLLPASPTSVTVCDTTQDRMQ